MIRHRRYSLAPLGYDRSVHSIKADIHYRTRNQRWYFDGRVSTALTGVSGTIPGIVFIGTCSVCNSFGGYRVERNSASGEPGWRGPARRVPVFPVIRSNTLSRAPYTLSSPPPLSPLPSHRYIACETIQPRAFHLPVTLRSGRHPPVRLSSSCPSESFPRLSPVHSDTIAS